MKNLQAAIAALPLLFAATVATTPLAFSAEEAATKPTGAEGTLVKVEAKVTAIDLHKREVTVKDSQGNETLLRVGEEARNLPQLEIGDTVVAEYFHGMIFHVEPAGTGKPLRVEKTLLDRTPSGQKPGASTTTYVEIVARVEGLDIATRMVTLRGPKAVVTLKVEDDVDLSTVKLGDMVTAHFVESYAIAVEER